MVNREVCDECRGNLYSAIEKAKVIASGKVSQWAAGIIAALLAGAIGGCFTWLGVSSSSHSDVNERVATVEVHQEMTEKLLDKIDKKVDRILEQMKK